jgi:hypothetical protein
MDVDVTAKSERNEPRTDESRADNEMNRAASTAGTQIQL